jgi:hypothetical protein
VEGGCRREGEIMNRRCGRGEGARRRGWWRVDLDLRTGKQKGEVQRKIGRAFGSEGGQEDLDLGLREIADT